LTLDDLEKVAEDQTIVTTICQPSETISSWKLVG